MKENGNNKKKMSGRKETKKGSKPKVGYILFRLYGRVGLQNSIWCINVRDNNIEG